MKLLLLKAVLPVLMLGGGAVAWAASSTGSAPTGASLAWIDAPRSGPILDVGPVQVQAHASAPGGVDRIQLSVDGAVVGESGATGDERLSTAIIAWDAEAGFHELTVRGHASDGWGTLSDPVVVQVGAAEPPTSTTDPGETSTTDSISTTTIEETTTTAAPQESTTTVPESTTTTTSPATTTTTPRPPSTPPTLPPAPSISVTTDRNAVRVGDIVRFTANAQVRGGQGFLITISLETDPTGAPGVFDDIGTCVDTSPCVATWVAEVPGMHRFQASVDTELHQADAAEGELALRVSP